MAPLDPAIIEVSAKTVAPGPSSADATSSGSLPVTTNDVDRGGRSRNDNLDEIQRHGGQWNNNYRNSGRGGYGRGGRGRGGPPNRQGNYDGHRNYGGRDRQDSANVREQQDKEIPKSAFDFDASNQALKEVEEKLKAVHGNDGDESQEKSTEETKFYDPDNFFDSISCEALEKQKDSQRGRGRPGYDRQKEREINAMTFGTNALPMNRTRSFQNQNRQGGQQRGGYRGGYNNYGGGYNNGYGQQRRGQTRYYNNNNRQGEQRQPQERVANRGGVPPKPSRTMRDSSGVDSRGDWFYDSEKNKWINAKDPIKQRNDLLMFAVTGTSGPRRSRPYQQQQNRQQSRQRPSFKRSSGPRSLVEVGTQKGEEIKDDVEPMANRMKKLLNGKRGGHNHDDCDKCSMRATDAEDWKEKEQQDNSVDNGAGKMLEANA